MSGECRNGHPRTEENTYRHGTKSECRECRRRRAHRYAATPKGREAKLRHNQTGKRRWSRRKYRLALARAATLQRLDDLAAEEAVCLTLLERQTQTR